MFQWFKKKNTTSNESTSQSYGKQPKNTSQILNEINRIVSKKYRDVGIQGNMICVSVSPSVFASWNNIIIGVLPHKIGGYEIHFRTFLAEGIDEDLDPFYALIQLNINESKYRFFWEDGLVGIAYVMDYTDNNSILEKEILSNIDMISLAASKTYDMFSRYEVKSLQQWNQFRFLQSSKDDEEVEKMVPVRLNEYNLEYEKVEDRYTRAKYLVKATPRMEENNIKLSVDIVDSAEYAFVFKTQIPVRREYPWEARSMAGHNFSQVHPRYTFLFDSDEIEMRYAVSLNCYDESLFKKITEDMIEAKNSLYTFLNS